MRISKRFILVTSLYHKGVSIGLSCKDEKCTIRNKCEIWIILICCYQSWKKLAIELLFNLLKNLSVKKFKKWLRNKNHPHLEFSKAGTISFTTSPLNKNRNCNVLYFITDIEKYRSKDPYPHYRTMFNGLVCFGNT